MGFAYIQTHENSLVHGLFMGTLFYSVHFMGISLPMKNTKRNFKYHGYFMMIMGIPW